MNIPAAIEIAFAELFKNNSDIGAGTVVRAWQTLSDEQALAEDGTRIFPMIDVRCGPPMTTNQTTRYCDVMILCGTHGEDDRNHSQISALFEAVQYCLDLLNDEFRARTAGGVWDTFSARITEFSPEFKLAGMIFNGGDMPYEDNGINFIGQSIRVHYCR